MSAAVKGRSGGRIAAAASEVAADQRVDTLLILLATTPVWSSAGVIAKLAVLMEWGATQPEADGLPWSFLDHVLSDLVALSAGPAAAQPGKSGDP